MRYCYKCTVYFPRGKDKHVCISDERKREFAILREKSKTHKWNQTNKYDGYTEYRCKICRISGIHRDYYLPDEILINSFDERKHLVYTCNEYLMELANG